jgi:hypothetical protein
MGNAQSTRLVVAFGLEDDDPSAQLENHGKVCNQFYGSYERRMSSSVRSSVSRWTVALGIPTYYQIVKEPMDLENRSPQNGSGRDQ